MQELRLVAGDVLEEGTDRGQPRVATSRFISAPGLDERQEASDQIRIYIGDLKLGWLALESVRSISQQQTESVAIARHRIRACMKLAQGVR
jgi:hypothetical protein